MEAEQIEKILKEIKGEYYISPFYQEETVKGYIKEAEQSIKNNVSDFVDFDTDLQARSLLKNYVKYALENLKDEFEIRYAKDYTELQINYATKH